MVTTAMPTTKGATVEVPPVEVPVVPPAGTWHRDAGHFPNPHSPVGRSIFYPLVTRIGNQLGLRMGLLIDGVDTVDIGGWHYIRFRPYGGEAGRTPPGWVAGLMMRLHPGLRRRSAAARRYLASGEGERVVRAWYEHDQRAIAQRSAALARVDRTALDDPGLTEHLDEVMAYFEGSAVSHFEITMANLLELYLFASTARELVGWDDATLIEALAGTSFRSSEPARKLAAIASAIAASPAASALFSSPDEVTPESLAAADPEIARSFEDYRWSYGMRALSRDIGDPTLADDPSLLARLIADQLAGSYDAEQADRANSARRDELLAEARERLRDRPADRDRFESMLRRGQRAYAMREDNVFWAIQTPLGILHHVVLEFGRRLAQRDQIDAADDVVFLEIDEVRAAFGSGDDMRAVVLRRKGERAWVLTHPGPNRYGPVEDEPDLRWFPRESRIIHEAFLWVDSLDQLGRPDGSAADEGISGVAASPGTYTGPVRVILEESQFGKMRAGDVIVCPVTQPTWSVLFPSMGAIVTDTGGMLAHPAIIAREFRVPAVVGTGNATERLRDDQIVVVDGSAGTVTLVD